MKTGKLTSAALEKSKLVMILTKKLAERGLRGAEVSRKVSRLSTNGIGPGGWVISASPALV